MILSEIPNVAASCKEVPSDVLRKGIGYKVEDPIGHFDQERKFGENARMEVVRESGGVGRVYGGKATAGASLGWMTGVRRR